MTTKSHLWLALAFFFISLPVAVQGQGASWSTHTDAGTEALKQRRYEEAERQFEEALKQAENFDPRDPRLLTSIDYLATAYLLQKKYAEAEALYRRALSLQEAVYGPEHLVVADRLMRLSDLYSQPERGSEAEPLLLRALEIKEKNLGADNPSVAFTLINLAYRYGLSGRDAEAEPLNRRGLAILEKTYGTDASILNAGLTYLAAIRLRQGRYDEAEALYRRVQEILEKSFVTKEIGLPESSRSSAKDAGKLQNARLYAARLNNLTGFLMRQRRDDEAEAQYRHALKVIEQEFGPSHLTVGMVLERYATLLRRIGREGEAVRMEERVKSIKETGQHW